MNEFILYNTEDGKSAIKIILAEGTKSHSEMVAHVEKQYLRFEESRKNDEIKKSEVEFHDDLDDLVTVVSKKKDENR